MISLSSSDCGLDLECGNLTLVCDSPSHYAISFGELSYICLSSFLVIAQTLILGAISE